MNLLKLKLAAFAGLALVTACGGKKASETYASKLAGTHAVTVSQNFPAVPGNGGEFASAVAVSGNLAVVGAPGDTNPLGRYTGAA